MTKNSSKRSPIPSQFQTAEEAGEYWDTHDLADYEELTKEAQFETDIQHRVFFAALEPNLAKRLAELAHKQGISTETLINVWLAEKVDQMI